MVEALNESEIDYVVNSLPLKVVDPVVWTDTSPRFRSRVPVVASGSLAASLVLDLSIPRTVVPGKYTYQLRQLDGPVLRRLDVRGSHRNRQHTGSSEVWHHRTHKHTHRDVCEDAFAYTPTDIPATSSPASHPEPGEHEAVYLAFCEECGIEAAGTWVDPWDLVGEAP